MSDWRRDELQRFVSPGRRRPDRRMIERHCVAGAGQVIVPLLARNLGELAQPVKRLPATSGLDA